MTVVAKLADGRQVEIARYHGDTPGQVLGMVETGTRWLETASGGFVRADQVVELVSVERGDERRAA